MKMRAGCSRGIIPPAVRGDLGLTAGEEGEQCVSLNEVEYPQKEGPGNTKRSGFLEKQVLRWFNISTSLLFSLLRLYLLPHFTFGLRDFIALGRFEVELRRPPPREERPDLRRPVLGTRDPTGGGERCIKRLRNSPPHLPPSGMWRIANY